MSRKVLTRQDLQHLSVGARVEVSLNTIVTALAEEEAVKRGITIVRSAGEVTPSMPFEKTVALACDHGGLELKQQLKPFLHTLNYAVTDLGVESAEPVDYPDQALPVALAVSRGECAQGIIIDGAGIGSAMVANKVPGVRAALCYDKASARNSREHNNANVLTLGGRLLTVDQAKEVVQTWLDTKFVGGRHEKRVNKILQIEKQFLKGS